MTFVAELTPRQLWKHFDQILTIPRGSKNEEGIRQYVISVAQEHKLQYSLDGVGNIIIRKPGTECSESAPWVALQCHLDMVNEKNSDIEHDFSRDRLHPVMDGSYLRADGTTLGADNGIGIAACLAVLEESSLRHGPLECLFTVDEETGLTGAAALSPDMLSSTHLINLDSEEQESIYIGCAGGAGINITLPVERAALSSNSRCYRLALKGLKGGHSGVDIHLQRGNAIQLLGRALSTVLPIRSFGLAGYRGGNMHNAIPREAYADIVIPLDTEGSVIRDLKSALEEIRNEYKPVEPDLEFSIDGEAPFESLLEANSGRKVLNLLSVLPHGVLTMSYQIPDLVETSSNLATANVDDEALHIHMSYRSSTASALDGVALRIEAAAELAGAQAERVEGYPGWQPDVNSHLLCIAREVHQKTLGVEASIKAIHAGLECGLIKEKYPAMDMISIGPQIEYPHSPDERVEVDSVAKFYRFLGELLGQLAAGNLGDCDR